MWRLLKGEWDPGTAGLLGRELKAGRDDRRGWFKKGRGRK